MTKVQVETEWAGTPEGLAVVTAALADVFADRSVVLAAAEVDEARWRELSVACRQALAADVEGRARYAARYTGTTAALAAGEAPERLVREARGAWSGPRSAATATAAIASAPVTPEPPVAVAAPAPPVRKEHEERASPWAPSVEKAIVGLQVPAVPAAPLAPPTGMPARAPNDLDTTGATDLVLEPALPFSGALATPPPPSAAREVAVRPGATRAVRLAELKASFPFRREPDADAATATARPKAASAPRSPLDETSFVGVLVPEAALPFVEGAAAPPPPAAAALPPHDEVGETGFFTGIVIDEPLPFRVADEPPRSTPTPGVQPAPAAPALASTEALDPALLDPGAHRFRAAPLTLRQVAAALGELRREPARRASVLAQYRLTEELAAALDAELRSYLAAGAWAREAWARVSAEYEAWRRGRSGA
ncbi:MAG: hypothetical protein IT373_15080 [Polyangiaceae bacterium]|nr:hypothetical protein [Polyangiaceae bacterium]